jgi:phospholipase/lecithinase/hemolysin
MDAPGVQQMRNVMTSMIDRFSLGVGNTLQFGAPPPGFSGFDGLGAPPVEAPKYGGLYAFGDSLSDVGNDYEVSGGLLPTPFIYSDGRFTNGKVWVQDLAKELGLGTVKASLDGGRDFAYGGAETGGETLHGVEPIDLPSQLVQFLADDPHPVANALYTLSIGGNDVIDAISAYANNPSGATTDITEAVANETSFVGELALDGAKNFVILNVPDLGKTPEEKGDAAVATKLSALYDSDLATSLQALMQKDGINITLVDTFTLIDDAVADPAKYGLTNVTTPVWTGNFYDPFSGHLNAQGAEQNKYLFFDHLHPTAAGHLAVANLAYHDLVKAV